MSIDFQRSRPERLARIPIISDTSYIYGPKNALRKPRTSRFKAAWEKVGTAREMGKTGNARGKIGKMSSPGLPGP